MFCNQLVQTGPEGIPFTSGDFPNVDQFKEILSGYNIDRFERLKPKMIQSVDDMLGYDIPDLLKSFRNPYD